MLIAQMTDIHIGTARDGQSGQRNRTRFLAALARLTEGPNRPDILVLSGDVTEHGDLESSREAAALLADCPFPVWPMVGNHDAREALVEAFPQIRLDGGFLHYVIESAGLRVLLLDTVEPGRHGGAFCPARTEWLAAELDAHTATPTLIFLHHPPVVSGIEWLDPRPGEGWIERLGAVVDGRRQILAIHCGHLHRPLATTFRGIPLHVTPSVAPQVALDLRPIDAERPDERALVIAEPPAYALHRWDGARLATHYERVGDWEVIARYSARWQGTIEDMFAERKT